MLEAECTNSFGTEVVLLFIISLLKKKIASRSKFPDVRIYSCR